MIARIVALARADVQIRLRRASTAVIFLLLSASVYLWIPDPSTGRAFVVIDGRRALYNSAAIGMGSAGLAVIFVGLFGFYVISNAVRRDIQTRCGFVIGSTAIRNFEYVIGKFLGNAGFLFLFMAGFMASSMAMLVVRAEAPLQPLPFVEQYALLIPWSMIWVAAVAILFECVPLLAGRFGDVLYFFLWAGSIGVVAPLVEKRAGPGIWGCFDFTGMGFMIDQMQRTLHVRGMSIGSTTFDPRKPLFVFNGLHFDPAWIVPRLATLAISLTIVAVAVVFFHRFDPARVRAVSTARRNWLARLNAVARPVTRLLLRLAPPLATDSFFGFVATDALMTITATPLVALVAIGVAIAAIASPSAPVVGFAAAALTIAGIACRDAQQGTTPLIRATDRLRERFVWWKFGSTIFVATIVLLVPVVRTAIMRPAALPAICIGVIFLAAAATALGVISATPKTFIVLFLTFWYVVVNDRGRTPALDFAGFYGTPRVAVTAAFLGMAVGLVAAAQVLYAARLRRDG